MLSFLYWLFRDALFFFGMVAGRGAFPRPLSREEEKQAIQQMQAGDEDARCRLIEHNMRLVSHIAKKYTVPACIPSTRWRRCRASPAAMPRGWKSGRWRCCGRG